MLPCSCVTDSEQNEAVVSAVYLKWFSGHVNSTCILCLLCTQDIDLQSENNESLQGMYSVSDIEMLFHTIILHLSKQLQDKRAPVLNKLELLKHWTPGKNTEN